MPSNADAIRAIREKYGCGLNEANKIFHQQRKDREEQEFKNIVYTNQRNIKALMFWVIVIFILRIIEGVVNIWR